jgi:hypothetical protein
MSLRARTFEDSEYILIKSFQLNKYNNFIGSEYCRTTIFNSVSMLKFIRLIIVIYVTTNATLAWIKCNISITIMTTTRPSTKGSPASDIRISR